MLKVSKISKLKFQELTLLEPDCCKLLFAISFWTQIFVVVKDLVPCNNSLTSTLLLLHVFNALIFHRCTCDIWLINQCTMIYEFYQQVKLSKNCFPHSFATCDFSLRLTTKLCVKLLCKSLVLDLLWVYHLLLLTLLD